MSKSVSVIIATYNGAEKIGECLDALMRQTYPSELIEILVVDDYSTDNLEETVMLYPDVKYVRNEDVHCQPSARNTGIKESSGDVLLFLDDDSILRPEYIENIVEPFTVVPNSRIWGVTGRLMNVKRQDIKNGVVGRLMEAYARVFGISGFFVNQGGVGKVLDTGFTTSNFDSLEPDAMMQWLSGCNMAYSREAVEKTGLFDTKFNGVAYYDDADYSHRVHRKGYPIVRNIAAKLEHKANFADNKSIARLKYYQLIHNNRFFLKNVYRGSRVRYLKHLLAHFALSLPVAVYSIVYLNPKLFYNYLRAERTVLHRLIWGLK